jgi:hypothetical protein
LDLSSYGRNESEGKDFNEDTNFGKLKRIPHARLQQFLAKYRLTIATEAEPSLFEVEQELKEQTLDDQQQNLT